MSEEVASGAPTKEVMPSKGKEKQRWNSRVSFIFASMGAAIGFGNVWRFPQLAYEYGGGAFFIPYLMALFFIGIPLLVLEISLGQVYQMGDAGAFGSIHKRLTGIGVGSILCAYLLICYYVPLISWVVNAFFDSFGSVFPWDGLTGSEASDYFQNEIIGMKTLEEPDLWPTRLIGKNVGYLFMSWLIVFSCVLFGVKAEGKIAYFTMGLPIILMFVFLGRACTLTGSSDGIKAYIGEWDLSVLSDRPDCWSTAVSQIFFSIGVTFGIMTAFGSHCERDAPAFSNAVIISLSNSLFSFISGFAVFASLGYLSFIEGTPISKLNVGGFGLMFGSYPVVLSTLPGGEHWVRLLFVDLFLLGIDSAFALTEGVMTFLLDTALFRNTPRWKLALGTCSSAFLLGLIFATDAGLVFLDAIDFYINFVMLLVGFFETFGAGWVFGIEKQCETYGKGPVISIMITTYGSIIIACAVWFGADNNSLWGGFLALILVYLAGTAVTIYMCMQIMKENTEKFTWSEILFGLYLSNVVELRDYLGKDVGFLPVIWAYMIKFLIPPLLLICFINLAASDNDAGEPLFGNYNEYENWPYQTIGIIIVIVTIVLSLGSAVVPDRYACLINDQKEDENETEEKIVDDAEAETKDTATKGQGDKYEDEEVVL